MGFLLEFVDSVIIERRLLGLFDLVLIRALGPAHLVEKLRPLVVSGVLAGQRNLVVPNGLLSIHIGLDQRLPVMNDRK
jgi:hypothetical protein